MPPNQVVKLKFQEKFVTKKPGDSKKIKIALCYPNVYTIGMGGYTLQLLYALWNKDDRVICERCFLPYAAFQADKGSGPSHDKIPPIRTIENNLTLDQFDVIAFSIQYELDLPYFLWMLQNSHIPLFHEEREHFDDQSLLFKPLILVGGPVVRTNPLPIAKFIDFAFIGDLEPVIDEITSLLHDFLTKINANCMNLSELRQNLIQQLGSLSGMWNPRILTSTSDIIPQVRRVFAKNLDMIFHPTTQIVPLFEEQIENPLPFGETLFLEVNRGCPHGCRFCLTGQQSKPFRNRSLIQLQAIVRQMINETDLHRIVLIGASVVDHPQFENLLTFLTENKITYSIPSVRIESITPSIVQKLVQNGTKTVTFAPECGSDSLRIRLNKRFTNAQILKGCEILVKNGIQNLKMYFLFGLPFETDADLIAIPQLIQEIGRFKTGKESLRISLNVFIPKPHTPFESFIDYFKDGKKKELQRRYFLITDALKGNRQVKIDPFEFEESYLQTIFSLGDIDLSRLLLACSQTQLSTRTWFNLVRHQFSPEIQSLFEKIEGNTFGQHWWNIIDHGVSPKFLKEEWQGAENGKIGVHCHEKCQKCGVCNKDCNFFS